MEVKAVGLREVRAYLLRLTRELPKAQQKAVASPEAAQAAEGLARTVLHSVVTAVFGSEGITEASVQAEVDESSPVFKSLAVFIPLTAGTAAIHGNAAGQVTYARFMLPDEAENSFLRGSARAKLPRDFLSGGEGWEGVLGDAFDGRHQEAVDAEIARS